MAETPERQRSHQRCRQPPLYPAAATLACAARAAWGGLTPLCRGIERCPPWHRVDARTQGWFCDKHTGSDGYSRLFLLERVRLDSDQSSRVSKTHPARPPGGVGCRRRCPRIGSPHSKHRHPVGGARQCCGDPIRCGMAVRPDSNLLESDKVGRTVTTSPPGTQCAPSGPEYIQYYLFGRYQIIFKKYFTFIILAHRQLAEWKLRRAAVATMSVPSAHGSVRPGIC